MKKKESGPPAIPGWQFVDNFRGNCYACGKYFHPGDVIYWKKQGDRSMVACLGCAREEAEK